MHIHILGICGTFMGGLAVLAKEAGHRVTGCDANVYPPMSTQLEAQGIELIQGYGPEQVSLNPDLYVVGNVMTRGNPLIEEILNRGLPYVSGPQWIGEHILREKWVLAVAGTHGKTTTSSMLAWILEDAGYAPGFLIGGVPMNFGISARLSGATDSDFFVIEADEYDTAFFDKRSKFVHYHAKTAVLNNLEFDHADIFPDIGAIETQFHHLVRTVPGVGRLIVNGDETSLARVIKRGCWSEKETFGVSDGVDWAMVEHPGGSSTARMRPPVPMRWRRPLTVVAIAVGWCAKSSYTVMLLTTPRTSIRRLTLWKRDSESTACATGTPTWRAAAIAASAFERLCLPVSSQWTVPWFSPLNITSKLAPPGCSIMAQFTPCDSPKVSFSLQQPRLMTRASEASSPFTTSRPTPGTVRTR